jgi:hypothetical protein
MTPEEGMAYDRPEPTEAEYPEGRAPFDVLRERAGHWAIAADFAMIEAHRLREQGGKEPSDAVGRLSLKEARVHAADAGEYASLARALAAVADLYSEPITVLEEYRPPAPLSAAIEQAQRDAADLMRPNRT